MGIISTLLGTGNVIEKGIEIADEIHHSPEEQAGHKERLLALYEPFKLAQRFLALVLAVPYVLIWCVCVALMVASGIGDACLPDVACKSTQLFSLGKEIGTLNNEVLGLKVLLALGFYFGGGAGEGIIKSFIGKGK